MNPHHRRAAHAYPDFYVDLGLRLCDERRRLGWTQQQLAAKLGVHKNTILNYETGQVAPDARLMADLFDLGVDIHYLLGGRRLLYIDDDFEQALLSLFRAIPSARRKQSLAELVECVPC